MTRTVLIVDDEKELCEIIAMQIDIPKVKTLASSNSIEAFNIIASQKIDLVVTDFKMPGMNGCELVSKATDEIQDPPVFFMMTGFSDFKTSDLKKHGVSRLYSKPGDMTELIYDIEKFFH